MLSVCVRSELSLIRVTTVDNTALYVTCVCVSDRQVGR